MGNKWPSRNVAALVLGLLLGSITGWVSVDAMQGAPFLFLVASIVNPIVVCLVARGWFTLIGILPNLTAYCWLIFLMYCHAHKHGGVEFSAFLHSKRVAEGVPWFVGFFLLSLVVSVIMHGVRTFKAADFHDPSKEQ